MNDDKDNTWADSFSTCVFWLAITAIFWSFASCTINLEKLASQKAIASEMIKATNSCHCYEIKR